MTTKPIDAQHAQYAATLKRWQRIDNVCKGEDVKQYIEKLNPTDTSDEMKSRNTQYADRAVFARIAGRTAKGMVGMVFSKDPVLNVPPPLDYIKQNVDGAGISIYQQAQHALGSVVRKGRAGLLVDYPATDGSTRVADLVAHKVFATIQRFEPEQIINWRLISNGAQVQLGRVVLSTTIEDDDGNEIEIIRELLLESGIYVAREYVQNKNGQWEVLRESYPLDGRGNHWTEIPFMFVGSETNTPTIDELPMYDLCDINIGHYNNSAAYEDSVFIVGQPQPWMSGIDEQFMRMFTDQKMYIGSGKLIGVPRGEQLAFAQAQPNSMAREAMKDKEALMISMGAMLLEPGSAAKTATQARGEQVVQHSTLSLASSNVSEAYTQCLYWMAAYMAIEDDELEFTLSKDFVADNASTETLQELVASWQAGATPFSDVVAWQQKRGIINPEKSLEDVNEEIGVNNISMPDLDANDDAEMAALEAAHPELSETAGA